MKGASLAWSARLHSEGFLSTGQGPEIFSAGHIKSSYHFQSRCTHFLNLLQ